MKKVLVTGADGFIGSHLVEHLVEEGHDVKAFCFYNSFGTCGWLDTINKNIRDSIEIFLGDVRDPYGVKAAMKDCDWVMHLAALIAIPYSYHSPNTYIETNVKGTLNIVQAAKELNIKKVVITSTSEVYGTAQFVPISEEHPLQGQSPYSASKIGADQIAMSFYTSFNTPISIIRPFNTYGPRQSARAVIPTVITQIASGLKTIKLGALSPTRDFNYIKDTVRGFNAVFKSDQSIGEVINIGSKYEISIRETVDLISDIMGVKINIECDNERIRPNKSEVNRLYSENSKALKLTGWYPEYSGKEGFRRGLEKTIDWFVNGNNLKYYNPKKYSI